MYLCLNEGLSNILYLIADWSKIYDIAVPLSDNTLYSHKYKMDTK